jgi:hypothetical protein
MSVSFLLLLFLFLHFIAYSDLAYVLNEHINRAIYQFLPRLLNLELCKI